LVVYLAENARLGKRPVIAFDYIFRGAPTVPVPGLSPALGFDYLNSVLYVTGATTWVAIASGGGGVGTVTSVGLVPPSIFTVSGSPVTTFGNITLGLANQTANTVFAGPASGSPAPPTFRSLVNADLPAGTVFFVTGEVPGGAINSINVTYTLANTPTAGTLALFQEGARLTNGVDYAISAITITFTTAPKIDDLLLADYRY
jgi:hypothetical protein